jgi:hypothetical protein
MCNFPSDKVQTFKYEKRKPMKTKLNWMMIVAMMFSTLLLASCGGGGGSSSTTPEDSNTNLVWGQSNWGEKNWQ